MCLCACTCVGGEGAECAGVWVFVEGAGGHVCGGGGKGAEKAFVIHYVDRLYYYSHPHNLLLPLRRQALLQPGVATATGPATATA